MACPWLADAGELIVGGRALLDTETGYLGGLVVQVKAVPDNVRGSGNWFWVGPSEYPLFSSMVCSDLSRFYAPP